MKKTGAFILATAMLYTMNSDAFARLGRSGEMETHASLQHGYASSARYHHGGGHYRSFTSVGFMFDMTPGYSPYYIYPSLIAVELVPVTYIQRNTTPANQYWYYCTQPQGYYPYIKECKENWLKVIPFPPGTY